MATILLLAFLQFALFPTTTTTTLLTTSARSTVPPQHAAATNKMTVLRDSSESIHSHNNNNNNNNDNDNALLIDIDIESVMSYELVEKWQDAHDTFRLRFAVPEGRQLLGNDPTLPTCIAVHYDGTNDVSGDPQVLKKSYSPISHPNQQGTFDLLVKRYPLRPGGGVGAYLCGVTVGESIQASVKPKRIMHLDAHVLKRGWQSVGLVAGGTGIAPLFQLAKLLLESNDSDDQHCHIQLLSIHRTPEDMLLRTECDELAAKYPHRFQVTYSLTGETVEEDDAWVRDRGSVDLVQQALPDPQADDGECMVFVCGKDGFVSHWAGPVARGLAPLGNPNKKGPKVQGPLLGLLKEAGYEAHQVFKY